MVFSQGHRYFSDPYSNRHPPDEMPIAECSPIFDRVTTLASKKCGAVEGPMVFLVAYASKGLRFSRMMA